MIKIEFLFIIIMFGFITSYLVDITYLKKLRSGGKTFPRWEVILANIFFGGPILLLFYIFEDYRLEDKLNHYSFLISAILLVVIQVTVIFLLFHFDLIIFLT